jgi:peptidoglycan pentaglycine glycine transferase (the first glycine)
LSGGGQLRSYASYRLDTATAEAWQIFAQSVSNVDYLQNPRWADVSRTDEWWLKRAPLYCWSESDGTLVLTAVVLRRTLPIPHRYHYSIPRGPVFASPDVFERWLSWALPRMEHDGVRISMAPRCELHDGGDEIETILERAGFVRRRILGSWATLVLDVSGSEDAVLHSFRRQTRQAIRKCQNAGIEIISGDTPSGRASLAALISEMAERVPTMGVLSEAALARASSGYFAGGRGGTILLARAGNKVVAGALVVRQGSRGYLVALPSSRVSIKMPTSHLIVWEAIRWAKSRGCTTFDLEGYSLVARQGEALWGVNQFKRGFAPRVSATTYVAIHEKIVRPIPYAAWRLAERTREKGLAVHASRRNRRPSG